MVRHYKPYVPKTIGELLDQLGFMFLSSPRFEDIEFPGQSIDTVFLQLNQGLSNMRKQLGEERFQALSALSAGARTHFEGDPLDNNGEAQKGRRLLREMEEMLEMLEED
jgi:hypothetical protein